MLSSLFVTNRQLIVLFSGDLRPAGSARRQFKKLSRGCKDLPSWTHSSVGFLFDFIVYSVGISTLQNTLNILEYALQNIIT